MNHPPDRPRLVDLLPTIDRDQGHVRTPGGNIIPFAVAVITVGLLAVIAALEATFGISNWVSIPAALLTIGWAGTEIDEATIRHDHREEDPTRP